MNLIPQIGTRIRSKIPFRSVPQGTEGVVDEHYVLLNRPGFMVAWDLPDRPLPVGYSRHDGKPPMQTDILRDGFEQDELQYLEAV